MKTQRRLPALSLLLLAGVGCSALLFACGHEAQANARAVRAAEPLPPADAALEAYQAELLDIAFSAVSKLPLQPHVKNRARSQAAIVTTCLELDLPGRALRYAAQIPNWRRGVAYADLVFDSAERNHEEHARHYLDLARQVAASERGESAQGWRRDRIRVGIARTYVLLGDLRRAAEYEAGVVDSEQGKVAVVKATTIDERDLDEQLEALDSVLANGSFDVLRNALATCARLHDRFYGDPDRRAAMERRIHASGTKVPLQVRIDLAIELARNALAHDDSAAALRLADEARGILDGVQMTAEHRIPLMAGLAALRFSSGEEDQARAEAGAALALFDEAPERIIDMFRAGVLRPLAEAYSAMGDTPDALDVYERALVEGARNPNARPRAMDLAATCCSMARHGVEPSEPVRTLIDEIAAGLGDPW